MRNAHLRLDELLLARATVGLDATDTAELDALLAAYPDVDADAYERAAAIVCLASLDTRTALPQGLQVELERRAAEFVASAAHAWR